MLLKSSDPKGICYVETKNLDGETNLKTKQTNKEVESVFITDEDFNKLDGYIQCEKPNNAIYKFEGVIKMPQTQNIVPLNVENLLLRGSSLKNTEYVYGVAVFTGH